MSVIACELRSESDANKTIFSSVGDRKVIVSLLLVLITLVLYNPVIHNGFVSFDDPGYVTTNRHIHNLNWTTIKWAFLSTAQANWHPLTWISHALDWHLFGARAAGHHYHSVLLHALCVVLLFLFLEKATGFLWRSVVVAVLFAVHPINVESVAWVAERKNVLCTVFFLLALMAYVSYARTPSIKKYLLVVLWFVLGLMSKPMVITLPFVLLLLDYWPLGRIDFGQSAVPEGVPPCPRRSLRALVLEKLPLFALIVPSAVITMVAQRRAGAMRAQYTLPERLTNAAVSYARYIGKGFWPSKLACIYPHPDAAIPVWQVAAAAIFLTSATVLTLKYSRRRYLIVGWLWFLGTLVPVIGLVQVGDQAMADRYAYLPFIGLFIMVVWAVADCAKAKRISSVHLGMAALAVIAVACVITHIQIGYWHDGMTLWSHALAVTQRNFTAHDNLGVEFINQGKIAEAKAQFQAAIDINPRDAFSQLNIGVCEKDEGNTKAAIEHYAAALDISSDPTLRSVTLGDLAAIYRRAGNYRQAQWDYAEALELDPGNTFALIGMGLTLQKSGDTLHALAYYSKAVETAPSDVTFLLMSQSLEKTGQHQQADAAFAEAKKISQNFAVAQQAVKEALQ